jgi:hypothetical protein
MKPPARRDDLLVQYLAILGDAWRLPEMGLAAGQRLTSRHTPNGPALVAAGCSFTLAMAFGMKILGRGRCKRGYRVLTRFREGDPTLARQQGCPEVGAVFGDASDDPRRPDSRK